MLERLRRQLAARRERLQALLAITERDLTADEAREFDTLAGTGEGSVREAQDRATAAEAAERAETERAEAEDAAQRADSEGRAERLAASERGTGGGQEERAGGRPTGGARTQDPEVYARGGRQSYFRDLTFIGLNLPSARDAGERMQRHSRQVSAQMAERALSTTDGAGGDFVPPLWMIDEFVALARAGRVTADLTRRLDLPTGTDSINLPRLATGTAVAEQATQNTAVQNTDATTNSVEAKVATIAGQQVVALQLIEQSPINMDEILLADLAADYAIKADVYVISNNAAGKRGLLNVTGKNTVTYTDASPTLPELWPKMADSIQQIHTGRLMPADVGVMHPRRWAWMTGATDSAGRPLITTNQNGPFNAAAIAGENVSQGWVANMQGIDWYVDPNIPTNLGAGTNEDIMIVFRSTDVIFFEGTPRSDAFRETKADQLSVLLRFYNYAALHSERLPKAISTIGGTGLVTPTF